MTETAKERIYREALDEINNLAIDVAMNFEETGIDSVDCGKIMDIVYKAFFAETNRQPFTTDKLSVEKLQEENNKLHNEIARLSNQTQVDYKLAYEESEKQLDTLKKHIEHVIGTIKHDGHLGTIQTDWVLPELEKALAAIHGNDD